MNWLSLALSWALPLFTTLLIAGAVLWILRRAIPDEPGTRIVRQMASLAIIVLANIALVLSLPFATETTGQLLSLFGLVITAVIALSSTTFVSNAMAGFMLRSVSAFKPGDFISVANHFGRVTEKGLLHTEIQSEDRDLVILPNLLIMNQPLKVVRASGTLISAGISLGYDVQRRLVRDLLKQAAIDAQLSDPFIQITELGDYAVSYRIYGFLEDVSNLITKRTELRSRMLDVLHAAGVEIVSPGFVNQRRLEPTQRFVPATVSDSTAAADTEDTHAEKMMFDKAEIAARIATLRDQRDELKAEIEDLDKGSTDAGNQTAWRQRQLDTLEGIIATLDAED